MQLTLWRQRNQPNLDPESEGASLHELDLVQQIGYLDQYRIELGRPRNYEKEKAPRKS